MRGIGVLACLAAAMASVSCSRDSRQAKPKVVVYCSVDQQFAEEVLAEFEKATGIDVLACFDTEATKTTGLANKLLGEKDRPVADVFWSSEVFHTVRLARHGVLETYESESTRNWPEHLRGEKGQWYGFALRGRVIAYNTDRVKPSEAPRSLEDLLEAKWKGRICMANPAFGTTGGHVASWFAQYGPQRAEDILRRLKANDIFIAMGNSDAVRRIARGGRVAICLTDTDDVYVAQRNGQKIAMNFCDQGGRGALGIPNTAAVVRGRPHPKEAAVLMEFLLSAKLERMLAESDSHNSPTRAEVAAEYPQYSIPNPLKVGYEKIADQFKTAIGTAGRILEETN